MKRERCQAVAKATGSQCEKNSLLGGSYCWIHSPKKEPFVFLIIGAFLGVGIEKIYDSATTSPEETLISDLRDQIDQYQDSIEAKDERIAELEVATSAILDYSEIARLDALGNPPGFGPGGDISYNSELTRLLDGAYELRDGRFYINKDRDSEIKYREVIEKYPKFPFTYYFVALCLRDRGDIEWLAFAKDAINILEQTVKIDGHNSNHDEILQKLQNWVNEHNR